MRACHTVRDHTIIIIKGVPVRQCANGSEEMLEDAVMAQVDSILAHANAAAALEVIAFAAEGVEAETVQFFDLTGWARAGRILAWSRGR
jgi:hypothetical protein